MAVGGDVYGCGGGGGRGGGVFVGVGRGGGDFLGFATMTTSLMLTISHCQFLRLPNWTRLLIRRQGQTRLEITQSSTVPSQAKHWG